MRFCLLGPPAEADHAARLLDAAANAILDGQMDAAADLLRKADIRTLHAYAASVMSPTAEILGFKRSVRRLGPEKLAQPLRPRMPTGSDADTIFKRDGYRCRYCGCKVVRLGVRSLLTGLFPHIVRWPSGKGGDRAKHAAFYALNGVLDHVEPYARGGGSSVDNIVTACWPCNFGKENYTIEELGLFDPRLLTPVVDDWDGLERLMHNRGKLSKSPAKLQISPVGVPPRDIDAWLALMAGTTSSGVLDALRDLLVSLDEITGVSLSIRQNLIVNVVQSGRSSSILGLSLEGDVDVPWMIAGGKDWFKPFAESVAEAIPEAILYETPKMWRVDGCGQARGQITADELVGAATFVLEGVKRLAESQVGPRL